MKRRLMEVLLVAGMLAIASAVPARGPVRASEANTRGWQLMTPKERLEHQSRIRGFGTLEACRAYQREHHALMAARARDRGLPMPGGGRDICAHLNPAGIPE
jgi:hypothetical protein